MGRKVVLDDTHDYTVQRVVSGVVQEGMAWQVNRGCSI